MFLSEPQKSLKHSTKQHMFSEDSSNVRRTLKKQNWVLPAQQAILESKVCQRDEPTTNAWDRSATKKNKHKVRFRIYNSR